MSDLISQWRSNGEKLKAELLAHREQLALQMAEVNALLRELGHDLEPEPEVFAPARAKRGRPRGRQTRRSNVDIITSCVLAKPGLVESELIRAARAEGMTRKQAKNTIYQHLSGSTYRGRFVRLEIERGERCFYPVESSQEAPPP